MREVWYSDNRDLVKWATLIHVARAHQVRSIVQVPYWRPESTRPHFVFQNTRTPVPDEVWSFFRDIRQVERLGKKCGIDVRVVIDQFSHGDRGAYAKAVKRHLDKSKHPALLFLDPDTGIEPKTASVKHTTREEIASHWGELKKREWLVLYQHARRERSWIESVTDQLSTLCVGSRIEVARSEEIGKDVAFFCVEKCVC